MAVSSGQDQNKCAFKHSMQQCCSHTLNKRTFLSISWETTEPGAAEDGGVRQGEVLLLLLAGPQRHRQREGNIGVDDGGARRGAGSTGTSNCVCETNDSMNYLFSG